VDMHSLRHGYITALAKAGVPVKVLQTLARHSDPKLTLNVYSHLSIFDTAAALVALPDLTRTDPEPLAMTGTDPAVTPINDPLAHHLPTGGDGSGRELSVTGGMTSSDSEASMGCNPVEVTGVDASGRDVADAGGSAPRRTRTYNPLIKSQSGHRRKSRPQAGRTCADRSRCFRH
jgi:Phage integrase family